MLQDQLFKEVFQEFFREFLELFYPSIAARLDFDQVTFLDKETFTDLSSGSQRVADLVAPVQRRDGTPEVILIHIEVQTQRRREFAQRMFDYYALFRLRHRLSVYPIAVYLTPGAGGIVDETYTEQLFDEELLRFRYKVVGLPDLQADDYLTRPNPLGPALSSLMRVSRTSSDRGRILRKASVLRQQAIMEENEARRALLLNVIEQYLVLDATEQAEFDRLIEQPEFREVQQMITPYEQRGIEIGLQQGISQGVQQGIQQGILQGKDEGLLLGMRESAFQIIQARFGATSETMLAYVESIDNQLELKRLIDRLLTADSSEAAMHTPN